MEGGQSWDATLDVRVTLTLETSMTKRVMHLVLWFLLVTSAGSCRRIATDEDVAPSPKPVAYSELPVYLQLPGLEEFLDGDLYTSRPKMEQEFVVYKLADTRTPPDTLLAKVRRRLEAMGWLRIDESMAHGQPIGDKLGWYETPAGGQGNIQWKGEWLKDSEVMSVLIVYSELEPKVRFKVMIMLTHYAGPVTTKKIKKYKDRSE